VFLPTSEAMDLKKIPTGVVPRAAALVVLGIVFTAGVTWAASQGVPKVGKLPPLAKVVVPKKLVVPDVRKEAFVFAKGTLEDGGFAWRVVGAVRGYPANIVVSQSPAPGTKIYDTGAPLVRVKLAHNGSYGQRGLAENASPYAATAVMPVETAAPATPATAPAATAPTTTPTITTETTTTITTTTTAPATTAPATTTTAPQQAAAPPKPAATTATSDWPKTRPPAFIVAGAKKEPLDEMPLTDRARMLGRWLAAHPERTPANVDHWLYQNAWVVDGAKFGWWHGADALRTLIAVDRHADALWGIGTQSADLATQALSYVQAKSKS
jgi:hypothetical protein